MKKLSLFLLILCLVLSYVRLFLGVDLTDEALYVGDALLPWLGGKPFVNELYLQQTASLLYSPLVGLYHLLVPEKTGLVLFVRHLYWFLALASGYNLSRLVSETWQRQLIFAVSLSFVPASIVSLSYNSLGYYFLLNSLIGAVLLWRTGSWKDSFLYGLFCALCLFVYPSLVFVFAVLSLGLIWKLYTKARLSDARPGFLVLCSMSLLIVGLFSILGFDNLRNSLEFSQHFAVGDTEHLLAYSHTMLEAIFPPLWLLGVMLILAAFVFRNFSSLPPSAVLIAVGSIFFVSYAFKDDEVGANFLNHIFVVYLACFSILFLVLRRGQDLDRLIAAAILVAMFSLSLTSSNALFAAAYPGFAAVLFGFAFSRSRPVLMVCGGLALILCLFYLSFSQLYREKSISSLDTWVDSGAFAGLLTNSNRAQLLKQVDHDLKEQVSANSVLFYDSFPAGYLLSSLRPASLSLYMQIMPFGAGARQKFVDYYNNPDHLPDVVFDFKLIELDDKGYYLVHPPDPKMIPDPMRDFFLKHPSYSLVHDRSDYRVFRRRL